MVSDVVRLLCRPFAALSRDHGHNLTEGPPGILGLHNNIARFEDSTRFIDLLNQSCRRRDNEIHRVSERS